MENQDIKSGDTVMLKSGGGLPIMTVLKISGRTNAICSWFNKNEEEQRTTFTLVSLKKVDPEDFEGFA